MPQDPNKTQKGIGLNSDSNAVQAGGKSWFFGIGINKYAEFPPLNNAVKDVQDLVKLLQEEYDLVPEYTLTLYDDKATRKNVISTLDRLERKIGPTDKLIIYYSGHGHLNKYNGKGYWIPTDAERDNSSEYIRNSTIREYVETLKSLHTLLISDACFSGSLFVRGGIRSKAALTELASLPSRWAICSGRHDEEVYDGEPGGNSPFAASIIDTLRRNSEKEFNVAKLVDRVVEQTRSNYRQLPEGNPLYGVGHMGGQYIFWRRADEAEDWAATKASGTLPAYRQYLKNHLNGRHVAEAEKLIAFLEEEAAWEKAITKNTLLGYYTYDQAYPNGRYSRVALDAIEKLEEEASWQKALRFNKLSSFRKYTIEYPNGKYRSEADSHIKAIIAIQQEPAIWKQAAQQNTPEAYESYLKLYPQGTYIDEASSRRGKLLEVAAEKAETARQQREVEQAQQQEKAAWETAQEANEEADYRQYLSAYPNGRFVGPAKKALEQLTKSKETPMTSSSKVEKTKSVSTFRVHRAQKAKLGFENQLAKWLVILAAALLLIFLTRWGIGKVAGYFEDNTPSDAPTVTLGGKIYRTVSLNGLTWMAQNMDYRVVNSWYHTEVSPVERRKYGRLYTWEAANKACATLGLDWRLPTDEEWRALQAKYSYKDLVVGGRSGFSALLGGYRNTNGRFNFFGEYGLYWSATESKRGSAWSYHFYRNDGELLRYYDFGNKALGFSCRCVQD